MSKLDKDMSKYSVAFSGPLLQKAKKQLQFLTCVSWQRCAPLKQVVRPQTQNQDAATPHAVGYTNFVG
jgi:hypothetical protein